MPLILTASNAAMMELANEVENGTAAGAMAWPGLGIGNLMSSVCTVSALCLTPILMMKGLISPPACALGLGLERSSRSDDCLRRFGDSVLQLIQGVTTTTSKLQTSLALILSDGSVARGHILAGSMISRGSDLPDHAAEPHCAGQSNEEHQRLSMCHFYATIESIAQVYTCIDMSWACRPAAYAPELPRGLHRLHQRRGSVTGSEHCGPMQT